MALNDISPAMLREAVRLYLEEAYGSAPIPAGVRARLAWPAQFAGVAELAATDAFQRQPPDVPPPACDRIRLRLGNRQYPHMKLGLDRVPDTQDWVFVVDCHDRQLLAAATQQERAAIENLIRSNNEIKTRIERRWTEAGLPTFERYIRDRLPRGGP